MRLVSLSALMLSLAGCGGSDSGGSSTVPPRSSPAPVPVPVPVPVPTPPPAPAPSPTYALATDFTADRDYPGWGVRLVSTYTAPPFGAPAGTVGTTVYSATIADETRAAGFLYAAGTRTYTARWFSDTQSFGPAESRIYQGFLPYDLVGASSFVRVPLRTSLAEQDYTRYVGSISWSIYTGNGNAVLNSESRDHNSIFGITTLPSDLPTGTSVYRLNPSTRQVGLGTGYVIGSDAVVLTVDWATGNFTGTWTIDIAPTAPPGTPPLAFNLTGRINTGSSRLSGTATGSGFTGTFTGAVFGPRAQEIGFAFELKNGSGALLVGVVGGKKGS